jgi:hypothetical protein
MPDIFSDGTRGNGFRYLKKFAAVALQGAIILAIVLTMSWLNEKMILTASNIETITKLDDIPFSLMFSSLTTSWVTVMLIQKSKDWAMDIIGA